jgi:hypothetical protein
MVLHVNEFFLTVKIILLERHIPPEGFRQIQYGLNSEIRCFTGASENAVLEKSFKNSIKKRGDF